MGFLERLVLPGLIVVIIVMTYIAMRGDKRQRRKLAELQNAETAAGDDDQDDDRGPQRPGRP
jgi:hypothetical protein